jgi:hypothetical protein
MKALRTNICITIRMKLDVSKQKDFFIQPFSENFPKNKTDYSFTALFKKIFPTQQAKFKFGF